MAAFGPADAEQSGMLVQELIGDGDRVVARLRVVGKHTGSHPRMPEPTGRDFDVGTGRPSGDMREIRVNRRG